MPFNIQGPELIIILIIALIVIGPGKLPEVGQALGKSIREFRKAATDVKDSTSLDAAPPAQQVAPPSPTATPPASVPPVAAPSTSVPPASADETHETPVS
jgi:TatA/E family protein of Tat protein translocase